MEFAENPPHGAIAVFVSTAMFLAWASQFVISFPVLRSLILIGAIGLTALPLCSEVAFQVVRRNFSVDILAFLSVVSAMLMGQYWVAAIVILMLSGGKALEQRATRRASAVLQALSRRMPQAAHRLGSSGQIEDIHIDSIAIGEALIIYPHELCPVDGVVVDGFGTMDESYLTGEPFLIAKAPGAAVLSGAINGDAALTIKATKRPQDSRYSKIVEVLHASEENRPKIRRLGDRLGMWYTPLSIIVATASWVISGDPMRFLAVLVIATPCPLLLAIPIAIIGAISTAARRGIVIKDPSILEKLSSCKTLIVDKTGTLTYGKPSLTAISCSEHWPERKVLQLAGSLERYSKHPLAVAVLAAAQSQQIPLITPEIVSEQPGAGLTGKVDGHTVTLTGRSKLLPELLKRMNAGTGGLECVIVIDNEFAALMHFADEPRIESKPFIHHLASKHGVQNVVLLSGDRPSEVRHFAAGMGIPVNYGGKSPEEKVEIVRELTAREASIYLGDGINDAPAMMNATVGIALGVNSDITSEAAGAVILQSSLASVDELIHIGLRLRRVAMTSAIGGMSLSAVGMAAGAIGLLAPIEGAILQEVIDLLAILNSLRMILPAPPLGDFKAKEPDRTTTMSTGSGPVAVLHQ